MNRSVTAFLLAGAALLAGCENEPTGQVAAVVNGEEITLQEINAELGAAQMPEGADEDEVRQAVLARIIDRRLLAQAAREDGLDQTPEYFVRQRQLEDALLVQLLRQREERAAEVPEQSEIDAFIEENPSAFGNRELYVIDRIQFARPADDSILTAMEADKTMDAVAARLQENGVQFTRQPARMDSARLGETAMTAIRNLPEGEPFILPERGVITVGVITDSRSVAATTEQARPAALQAMRNRDIAEALQNRLDSERAEAEISYQPGFEAVEGGDSEVVNENDGESAAPALDPA